MVKIEIDGNPLVLYPSQKIRFKMRNPMMYEDVLPKYYSYPFTIPLEVGKNSFLLNYPQLWKNSKRLSGSIDCMVYMFGQNNPRKSVLQINTASETSAEVNIIVDRNVDDIGDKNLRELDMGTFVLEDTVKKRIIIRPLYYNPSLGGVPDDMTIGIDDETYTVAPYSTTDLSALVSLINTSQTKVIATQITYSGYTCLKLESSGTGTNNAFTLNPFFVPGWPIEEETEWITEHTMAIRDSVFNIIDSYDPDIFPVTFPLIENVKYIEDDYYNGFQNSKFFVPVFDVNLMAFLTPMPHLCYILKKVFSALEFDAYGSFFEDESIKRIITYSNVAADYWNRIFGLFSFSEGGDTAFVYTPDKDVNVHSSVVNIANHCPDFTVKEFLTEIRKLFNLSYSYDNASARVEVFISQNKTENNIQSAPDYTKNIINKWQLQNPNNKIETVKLFKFEEDSNDEKQKQLGMLDYQQPLLIDANAKKEIQPKISSICEEKADSFLQMASLQLSGVYNNQGSVTKLKLLQYFNTPIGSIYDIDIPDWALTWFGPGDQIGSFAMNKDTYPYFSYVSTWSLRWDTEKGFYKKCWDKQTAFLNNGVQLKIAMTFNNTELAKMDKNPFHNLDGSIAIWKDIEVQLSENDNSQAECVYQLV